MLAHGMSIHRSRQVLQFHVVSHVVHQLDVAHQSLVTQLALHYDGLRYGLYIGGYAVALPIEEVIN